MERCEKVSLEAVVRVGVTVEQRPEGKEGTILTSAGRVFLTVVIAYAKALRREQ